MYITDLIVINYKSCQNVHLQFDKDAPSILIGINDSGKSTFLSALGLLLDAKHKFNYSTEDRKKDDISNTRISNDDYEMIFTQLGLPILEYKSNQSIIMGHFYVEEQDINENNQSNLNPHFLWVIEKSDDMGVWLVRRFDGELQKYNDFLLTLDDEIEPKEYFKASSANLSKARNIHKVTEEDIRNENKKGRYTNLEIIRAIYSKLNLKYFWIEYKGDKGIWPEYRYLDWNMSLDQLNQFVNDILTTKIETPLKKSTIYARTQADRAQKIVNNELHTLTKIINKDVPSIERLKVNVNFKIDSKVTDILINKYNCDGDINFDSQGEGIKRQLWFSLLKWKALDSSKEKYIAKKFIWCFDEPETHLYPKAQRDFFNIIRDISKSNIQTILSTHSTVFIDKAKFTNIHKADLVEGYTILGKCHEIEDIYQSLQLKNSDFLFYDLFLVVEGDTEQILIPSFYKLYKQRTLFADNVQLINLGGKDNRRNNIEIILRLLNDFKKNPEDSVVYILDRDAIIEFTPNELSRLNQNVFFVGKQDIEDSISSSIWVNFISNLYEGKFHISEIEIEGIKDDIPVANFDDTATHINKNQKFYPRLQNHIRNYANHNDLQLDPLPAKGKAHACLIKPLIETVDNIPLLIRQAFDKLT